MFSRAAREWAQEAGEARLDDYKRAKAMEKSRKERMASVAKKIGAVEGKEGEDAKREGARLEARLIELEQQEILIPPPPAPPYEDVTAEALAYNVALGWPSSGLVSDEGGLVVGSKGMAEEGALAFLALLNRLWDGRPFRPVRKVAKTEEIRGRRFSCSLMLQRELLEGIVQRGGRGVGFFARYLVCAPASTMGARFYTPPPENMPALAAFNRRSRELLEMDLPVNDKHQLEPPVMMAEAAAHEVWREYHDAVEAQMGQFGEFATVRDVAAKSAENAARIAGVFQVFDRGPGGALNADYMRAGVAVAAWHLTEASRLFFEADKPQEAKDAELLSEWLATTAPQLTRPDGAPLIQDGRLPLGEILRQGPHRLRNKDRRDAALDELAGDDVHRVRIISVGRRKEVAINPNLLNRHGN